MSDFFESPSHSPQPERAQSHPLEMLTTSILVALVVATLYVGREIFIPIAIAILVSFVLSPPILLLRRWGLGRIFSVLTVVCAALVIAFSVSAVLTRQVSALAVDLPLYQATINAKLDELREAAAESMDRTERSRPRFEVLITLRAYGDCEHPKMGADPIDCDGDVDVFVGINADDDFDRVGLAHVEGSPEVRT